MEHFEQEEIKKQILELCKETKRMSEIYASPEGKQLVDNYGRSSVKYTVYSLTKAGLLFGRGASQGKYYRTTRLGQAALRES